MKLTAHPFGIPYYHKPTGKVIYLQNKYSDGTWRAHFQYHESLVVAEEDLRYADKEEVERYYPIKVL